MWESLPPETVLQRVHLTVTVVPPDVESILEVGSGNGLIINALQQAGYNPFALDISHNALRQINSNKRVQSDVTQLPFKANSFDLVLACELLEHVPDYKFSEVLTEISKVASKYIIITVPYKEILEWNYAHCPACGCIFNGAYHVRSFGESDLKSLFKKFKCIQLKQIVSVLHPDRTINPELFIRHRLASEYRYFSPSVVCPLCLTPVDKRPTRNWIGWIASGMRYVYKILNRKKTPLWYLAFYTKSQ